MRLVAAVLAAHQSVLAGAVLVPVVFEGAHMHQSFHLGGGNLHEESVALHPADHPRQHLAHQRFGLARLHHGEQVALEFGQEAPASIQALHQPMLLHFQVGSELARGQQRPVDGAVAGIRCQIDGGFVAHTGAVLSLGEQQHQQLL